MSPRIESDGLKEIPNQNKFYYVLSLNEGELDVNEFDKFAKELSWIPARKLSDLKYIVSDEELYIFSGSEQHATFWKSLNVVEKNLKSAGYLRIYFYSFGQERQISGNSSTLQDVGLLSEYVSDSYKMNELKNKLGDNDFIYF